MKRFVAGFCSTVLLLGGVLSAQDEDSYARVYASSEASSDLPPNLVIAKGLPSVHEVGLATVKRIWDSYRSSTSAKKKLIPVSPLKSTLSPAAPATPAARE